MDAEENILLVEDLPLRSTRLGMWIEPGQFPTVDRTPTDQAEVARRVRLYATQYDQFGRIDYQPHKHLQCS